jgi:hypothetical protein
VEQPPFRIFTGPPLRQMRLDDRDQTVGEVHGAFTTYFGA